MNKICRRRINIRYGSFFECSKLQIWQILGLTYIWCSNAVRSRGLTPDMVRHELDIGSEHCRRLVPVLSRYLCLLFSKYSSSIGGTRTYCGVQIHQKQQKKLGGSDTAIAPPIPYPYHTPLRGEGRHYEFL